MQSSENNTEFSKALDKKSVREDSKSALLEKTECLCSL